MQASRLPQTDRRGRHSQRIAVMEPGGLCRQSPGSADTVAVSRRCAQPHRAHAGIQAGKTRFGALNATTQGLQRVAAGPCAAVDAGEDRHGEIVLTSWRKRPRCTGMVWRYRARSTGGPQGVIAPGATPHGKLHANAAGGDLLVSSASAWEHRPAGGDGAGRPGADRG